MGDVILPLLHQNVNVVPAIREYRSQGKYICSVLLCERGTFRNETQKASSLILRFDSIKNRQHGLIQLSKRV